MVCIQTLKHGMHLLACHPQITETPIIFRYLKLPRQIFGIHYTGMQSIKQAHINKDKMDVEQNISETI